MEKLVEIFLEKNKEINLSAIRDVDSVMIKHINDSLEINKLIEFKAKDKVIDLWSGGGFPMLPLAIQNPKTEFVWIDARKKKINAINEMIEKLWIKNAKWVWSRAEEHKDNYDILITRAVWYVDKLFKWWYHLVKKWWYFILYKEKNDEEYQDLEKICKNKKMKIEKIHEYQLFDWDITRVIYIIKK